MKSHHPACWLMAVPSLRIHHGVYAEPTLCGPLPDTDRGRAPSLAGFRETQSSSHRQLCFKQTPVSLAKPSSERCRRDSSHPVFPPSLPAFLPPQGSGWHCSLGSPFSS